MRGNRGPYIIKMCFVHFVDKDKCLSKLGLYSCVVSHMLLVNQIKSQRLFRTENPLAPEPQVTLWLMGQFFYEFAFE